jgi:hypothetical protein
VEVDQPDLEEALNVVPLYSSYRPVEKSLVVSNIEDDEAIVGGYSHLLSIQAPAQKQHAASEGALLTDDWMDMERDLVTAANAYHVDHLDEEDPDDTDWVRTTTSTGSVISWVLEAPLRTPTAPASPNVIFRFRCRVPGSNFDRNNHRVTYKLYDVDTATYVFSDTYTLANVPGTDWEEDSHILSNPEIALISNWSNLQAEFYPLSDGGAGGTDAWETAVDDVKINDYVDEDGGTTDIFNSIVHTSPTTIPNTCRYIQSPTVQESIGASSIFRIDDLGFALDPSSNPWTVYGWVAAQNPNMSVTLTLQQLNISEGVDPNDIQIGPSTDWNVIQTITADNIRTLEDMTDVSKPSIFDTPQQVQENVTGTDFDLADFSQPFYIKVDFSPAASAGSTTYLLPDEVIAGASSAQGVVTNVANCVSGDKTLADDTKTVYRPQNSGWHMLYFSLDPGQDRIATNGHKVWIRAKCASGTVRVNLHLQNEEDGTTVAQWSDGKYGNNAVGLTSSYQWYSKTVSAGKVGKIKDYEKLKLGMRWGNEVRVDISEIYFEYPGYSNYGRLYGLSVDPGPTDAFQLSHFELESGNPKNANIGDRTEIFVGTNSNIYEVDNSQWTEVTRASSDYGVAGLADIPKPWSFASFGNNILATNYADKLQYKGPTDALFDDVVDGSSPQEPRGRYVAVVGSHVVLCDINPTSYASGKPYSVWVSYAMDPTMWDLFDIDKQSVLFSLVAQPGQITGIVGGEYGVIFKRNSIWRMTYTGQPRIFTFDHIAIGQGCAFPESIVQVDQDVYFWGNGGIFRVRQGTQLERISTGRVEKAVFDNKYERYAVRQTYGTDPIENDTPVFGCYDGYTGLIWWIYRGYGDVKLRHNQILIYNPREDRFTQFKDADLDINWALGLGNVVTSDRHVNRGIVTFSQDDSTSPDTRQFRKFWDDTTFESTLTSKIMSSQAMGLEPGREVEIHKVRPIYKADKRIRWQWEDDLVTPTEPPVFTQPNFQFTVTAAQDPSLLNQVKTRTVDRTAEDPDGWVPLGLPVSGEFFRFELKIPELTDTQIKEIVGLQFKIRRAGDY